MKMFSLFLQMDSDRYHPIARNQDCAHIVLYCSVFMEDAVANHADKQQADHEKDSFLHISPLRSISGPHLSSPAAS